MANVIATTGGKVHLPHPGFSPEDNTPWPHCRAYGSNRVHSQFRTTDAPVTCTHCKEQLRRRELAASRQG